MVDYEGIIRSYIVSGTYVLAQLEGRIDALWIEGKLTDEQRSELLQLAANNAKDVLQINIVEKIANLETRVYDLEHPTDIYPIWQTGQVSERGVVYRFDVTGDGELDLVRYDGGRASTSLSIGKIEGWHMLDRELNVVATITRDADGGYVITPVNTEPEPETSSEATEGEDGTNAQGGENGGSDGQTDVEGA